jgi:Family of unknown function (DUF6481)
MSYKSPTFQDRIGSAAEAKRKALDKLRAKPPVDEAVLAARQAAQAEREAAAQRKREEKAQAAEQAKAAKAAADAAAAEEAAAAAPRSEAELKAARDARYAARKSRKK